MLYLLYNKGRAGEKNQVIGIAKYLKEYFPDNTITKEYQLEDKDAFLSDLYGDLKPGSKDKGIIVAAEVESIDVLEHLKPQSNLVISHSSHQYTKKHAKLNGIADFVALPKYLLTNNIIEIFEGLTTQIIQIAGVPHNLSKSDVEEAYQNNKEIIPNATNYIGVILGGDAETPDNKVLYYTESEALQLADYIATFAKEEKSHLLILNDPRTGKHDQNTGEEILTSHRDGNLDNITAAFVESLQSQKLVSGKDFTLFDFQFDKPKHYPVVLEALSLTNSPIFVAGESTSMISETIDCLPKLVTVYTNGAMNENHKSHCQSEYAAGTIHILENQEGKWQLNKALKKESETRQPASQIIAKAIMRCLNQKLAPS